MMPFKSTTLWYLAAGAFLFFAGQPALHGESSEVIVPIGRTEGGFTFTSDGSLLYHQKQFQPAFTVRTDSVRSFRISLRDDGKFAGAIAEDSDGQNSAFVLDLTGLSAIPLQPAGKWSGVQRVFWSPSGKHLVALCSYEGQRLMGVNLESRKVSDGEFLGGSGHLGVIEDEPSWYREEDVLLFILAETCDPYDAPECDASKVLARYLVMVDPETLSMNRTRL